MAVGIGMALVASLCFASGNLIEKWAVDRMPPFSLGGMQHAVQAMIRSPWWLLGALISVIGLPIQMVAYSRLAISVVQSISVAGVVLLIGAASIVFGERLGRREVAGLTVAITALVLVSLSLTSGGNASGRQDSGAAVVFRAVGTIVVVVVALLSPTRKDSTGFVFGTLAGLLYGLSGLGAKGLSNLISQYGWFGSISHAFESPYLYLFLVSWAVGLGIFQAGIQRSRVGVVGSLSTIVASAFVVGIGMVVFEEHLPSNVALRVLRIVGFAGILIGSGLVGWGGTEAITTTPVVAAVDVESSSGTGGRVQTGTTL